MEYHKNTYKNITYTITPSESKDGYIVSYSLQYTRNGSTYNPPYIYLKNQGTTSDALFNTEQEAILAAEQHIRLKIDKGEI
ncbi:hypothetical protein [uncultured Shewanella sp.]|uniref:hypothetical protein n=1 Tax=uncultured Shewanella sp. TaxID=173975 RepID=UPI00260DAF25|nr:hypothetical protein [uncultured Shewanella sp.]